MDFGLDTQHLLQNKPHNMANRRTSRATDAEDGPFPLHDKHRRPNGPVGLLQDLSTTNRSGNTPTHTRTHTRGFAPTPHWVDTTPRPCTDSEIHWQKSHHITQPMRNAEWSMNQSEVSQQSIRTTLQETARGSRLPASCVLRPSTQEAAQGRFPTCTDITVTLPRRQPHLLRPRQPSSTENTPWEDSSGGFSQRRFG